jgi:protoporphyrin/coproporphyrin ferrochelatase
VTKKGLLLVNLGTPDAPETGPVRRYLREFLSDPRVVDLNPVGRWALLNFIILPFRPRRSAEAYRAIWTPEGSPLLVHSRALAERVSGRLGGEWVVELGMRYGNPSLEGALGRLRERGAGELTVLPLYPLNAASTTATTSARVFELLARDFDFPPVRILPPFFHHAGFLDAFAEVARPVVQEVRADHVLFSYHGLPERHLRKSDVRGTHCLVGADCSKALTATNAGCYRAQAYHVARELGARLGLREERFTVSFQSRLGRDPWIRPYTDEVLRELAQQGVRRLAVVCPAFVADCLETLEEIGLRGRETFRQAGGEELALVPSLNTHPAWVDAVVQLVREGPSAPSLSRAGRPAPAAPVS